MGDKSLQKRNLIVESAREVFFRRGYKGVTMKDIVEACGISRGGLYLYFSNTKELFEAVLEQEEQTLPVVLESSAAKEASPGEILLMYLEEQKKEILKKKGNLTAATYEYLFENKLSNADTPIKKRFDENVKALEKLIANGVAEEWMICESPADAARNIVYAIEGMKVAAQTMEVTAKTLDQQIAYIMGTLGMVIKE
ncbi:MAG: TetR/AcrR family transcriptional regulator [Lachnospiraceae bacterium]|nr:TetR/AcrR family transcriptional regulator [Lachnospiraceae bacterium]